MKKLLKNIICLFLAVIIAISTYFGLSGYMMYKQKITEVPLDVKVQEIQNQSSYVRLDEISNTYINKVIESEDRRFYSHKGVDYIGLMRAIVTNLSTKSFKEGGSTITQQLSKNMYLSFEKNITRKCAEVFIARDLEKNYSKDEILELYLNVTYFGNGKYGIKQASRYYYGVDPIDLTDKQADALVYTLKRPNAYNPKKRSSN